MDEKKSFSKSQKEQLILMLIIVLGFCMGFVVGYLMVGVSIEQDCVKTVDSYENFINRYCPVPIEVQAQYSTSGGLLDKTVVALYKELLDNGSLSVENYTYVEVIESVR